MDELLRRALELDEAGEAKPQEIESAYAAALAAYPNDPILRGHWLSYLATVASMDLVREEVTTLDVAALGPDVYERIHLPLVALLLQRSELLLAQDLLAALPADYDQDLRVQAQRRRLAAFLVAEEGLSYAPAPYTETGPGWWNEGPFLLKAEEEGRPLRSWLAGAVEDYEDGIVYCSVLHVLLDPTERAEQSARFPDEDDEKDYYRGHLETPQEKLEQLLGPLPEKILADGYRHHGRAFFELGSYGNGEEGAEKQLLKGTFHESNAWRDPALPQPLFDPLRFLRHSDFAAYAVPAPTTADGNSE